MHEVSLPESMDPEQKYIAFEVDDYATPPAAPGWLLVFHRSQAAPGDLLNAPCLVHTADGRRFFKRLRQGRTDGRYDLENWDGSTFVEDVEIHSALAFAVLTPGRWAR